MSTYFILKNIINYETNTLCVSKVFNEVFNFFFIDIFDGLFPIQFTFCSVLLMEIETSSYFPINYTFSIYKLKS